MSTTATAIVQREIGGPLKLEELKLDKLGPKEALVEMHASGICHTDLGFLSGKLPFPTWPAVFSHEGSGVVVDYGSEVTGLSKGDKVLLSFAHCEECGECRAGHPAYCLEFNLRNFTCQRPPHGAGFSASSDGATVHGSFFGQSSFSSLSVVHRSSIVKMPPDTPLDLYASFGCGMITGAGTSINVLDVQPGDSIMVMGCGGVGMAAMMGAKIRQAKTIIGVDLFENRLELAKELGATHTINGKDEDIAEQVAKICPPEGVMYAIDATGVPACIETMVKALSARGTAVSVGAPPLGTTAAIDINMHFLRGRRYIGATEGDSIAAKMIPFLVEEHKKGNFPIEKLVKYYDAKDYEQAIEDMHSGKSLKPVLRWR